MTMTRSEHIKYCAAMHVIGGYRDLWWRWISNKQLERMYTDADLSIHEPFSQRLDRAQELAELAKTNPEQATHQYNRLWKQDPQLTHAEVSERIRQYKRTWRLVADPNRCAVSVIIETDPA